MATVFIWNNNNNFIGFGHQVTGHASINITDTWSEIGVDNTANYVSWWPQGQSTFGDIGGHSCPECFAKDLENENGYAPDHVIRIDEDRLRIDHMQAKWEEIRQNVNSNYSFYKKNCSKIAARVLIKGAVDRAMKLQMSPVWTPLQVKRLAYKMGGVDMVWDYFLNELKLNSGLHPMALHPLKYAKRRSSRHGFEFSAPPRFDHGQDTGQYR